MSQSTKKSTRKRHALCILGVLGLGAISCATEGDVIGEYQAAAEADGSGRRLHVISYRYKGEDGTRNTVPVNRFLDTKFGVECSFLPAEDGMLRCLPLKMDHSGSTMELLGNLYQDSSCTVPLHVALKCLPVPNYLAEAVPPPPACGIYVPRVHKIGAAFVPTSAYKKPFGGTACTEASSDLTGLSATMNFYPTTVMAPTEFVKGERVSVVAP